MKILIITASLLFSIFAFAEVPVTCLSDEKMGEASLLRFKINNKVSYTDFNDHTWKLHLVGVTPASGPKKIVYGSGDVTSGSIALTFVKDDFVLGSVLAKFDPKKGYYVGTASISIVNHNEDLSVKCIRSDKLHLIESDI